MARKIYRVLPDGDDWKVTLDAVFQKSFSTKEAAKDWAIAEAKANPPSQVLIHRKDGTIEEEFTYGDDPYPPPAELQWNWLESSGSWGSSSVGSSPSVATGSDGGGGCRTKPRQIDARCMRASYRQ